MYVQPNLEFDVWIQSLDKSMYEVGIEPVPVGVELVPVGSHHDDGWGQAPFHLHGFYAS